MLCIYISGALSSENSRLVADATSRPINRVQTGGKADPSVPGRTDSYKPVADAPALYIPIGLTIACAQDNTTGRICCEIVARPATFSTKTLVYIYFGQETPLSNSDKNQQLVNADGENLKFNSMVDALNYMSRHGWMFAQIYTDSTSDNNQIRHWLLYKDTTDQSGMFDGIMTKNNSTTINSPSPDNYPATLIHRSRRWHFLLYRNMFFNIFS